MHAVFDAADAPDPLDRAGPSATGAAPRSVSSSNGLQRRRLQGLIDYVQQSARSRARVVSNVTDHGMFLLFQHQVGSIDGIRLDDAGPDGEDEIWLSLPRPPSPQLPP